MYIHVSPPWSGPSNKDMSVPFCVLPALPYINIGPLVMMAAPQWLCLLLSDRKFCGCHLYTDPSPLFWLTAFSVEQTGGDKTNRLPLLASVNGKEVKWMDIRDRVARLWSCVLGLALPCDLRRIVDRTNLGGKKRNLERPPTWKWTAKSVGLWSLIIYIKWSCEREGNDVGYF